MKISFRITQDQYEYLLRVKKLMGHKHISDTIRFIIELNRFYHSLDVIDFEKLKVAMEKLANGEFDEG